MSNELVHSIAKILEALKTWDGPQFPIEIHARSKDEAHNKELFQKIVDIMAKQGVCWTDIIGPLDRAACLC